MPGLASQPVQLPATAASASASAASPAAAAGPASSIAERVAAAHEAAGGGGSVCIDGFGDDVHVLPTKTKPKKLTLRGDNGREYTYLLKGREDLHLDERIMQFLRVVNEELTSHRATRAYPGLRARHYAVIPLGARSGLPNPNPYP